MSAEQEQRLLAMQQAWSQCQGCMLSNARKNMVFGEGNPDANLLIIGEAPGATEDDTGRPFMGSAGNLLEYFIAWTAVGPQFQLLEEWSADSTFDISREHFSCKNIFYTNIVGCRPPENRNPTPKEIEACRPRLLETIYTVDPTLIITVGGLAAEALTRKKISITALRGQIFDCQLPGRLIDVTYPVLAVLHTSYLLRQNDFNQDGGTADKTYQDFVRAMHIIDEFNFHHRGMGRPAERPAIKGD